MEYCFLFRLDIARSLRLSNPFVAISTFDRPNLFYSAKPLDLTVTKELIIALKEDMKRGGSTIIYCPTIKDVGLMMDALQGAGKIGKTTFPQVFASALTE